MKKFAMITLIIIAVCLSAFVITMNVMGHPLGVEHRPLGIVLGMVLVFDVSAVILLAVSSIG